MSHRRHTASHRKTIFREGPKDALDFEKMISHEGDDIYFHIETPGKGYTHVVTEDEILSRLHELPDHLLCNLNCVVLPRMTRKRERFNIYGLQWGNSVYLYPMESCLTVGAKHKLGIDVVNEARQFGATIEETKTGPIIHWTPETIKLYYLENILIHELGHTYDVKNTSVKDREAYAEWFARKYGRWPKRKPRRFLPKPAGLVPKESQG